MDRETSRRLADVWDAIIVNIQRDLRKSDSLALDFAGQGRTARVQPDRAHRSASPRASWDDEFEAADLLRAHLFVFFALMAAIGGEVDIHARVAAYEPLVQELTAGKRDLPPAL
jgi:hypothetical protein